MVPKAAVREHDHSLCREHDIGANYGSINLDFKLSTPAANAKETKCSA